MNLEREALAAVFRDKRVWGVNVVGNAALFGLVYAWFWIPDAHVWQLLFSLLLAAGTLAAALWLHASTLATLARGPRRVGRLAAWAAVLALFLWLAVWLHGYAGQFSVWLASLLTMTLRQPVSPRGVEWVFRVLWAVVLIGGSVLLLPFAARGFAEAWRICRQLGYWLDAVVLVVAGFYLPWRLVCWTPETGGILTETLSLLLRFALAWLVMVTAWLLLHAIAAAHAPIISASPGQPQKRRDALTGLGSSFRVL
jgi:hypothetical protein